MSLSSRQQQRFWLLIAFAIVGYVASQYNPESARQVKYHETYVLPVESFISFY